MYISEPQTPMNKADEKAILINSASSANRLRQMSKSVNRSKCYRDYLK